MKKAIFIVFVIMVSVTVPGFAQKVSGQFKSSRKGVIKPTAVVAFPARSPGDPLKWITAVLVSEGTMNITEAFQGLDPRMALLNQEGMRGKNYISFWIQPSGYVGMNATFSEGMVQYIDSTKKEKGDESLSAESLVATFTENSANRVAGRIHTTKPVEAMGGETYELDVEFETVVVRPPPGKKLSAGGDEPGKTFQALLSAIKSKDWKGVQAGLSSEKLKDADPNATDAEKFESVTSVISYFLPKGKTKVLGGEQIKDTAILEVQGHMSEEEEGEGFLYLVRMVKEPVGWRFDRCAIIDAL